MSRTERLLELLVLLRTRQRFTAQELAGDLGVSRRTMLRDLQALSLLGVPLLSATGPGGGYTVDGSRRTVSLLLTAQEAIALTLAYEAFLRYRDTPFGDQSRSALTKLRAAMTPDVAAELDRLRERVAAVTVERTYEAPLLPDLLRAARDEAHLQITYDSRSDRSERLIYLYGLYAGLGFWYCACYDYRRAAHVSLRADRILSLERVEGLERPPAMALDEWLRLPSREQPTVPLRARITPRGMKAVEWRAFGHDLVQDEDGAGHVAKAIPESSLDFYARVFLPLGDEAEIFSPPELVEALCGQARAILRRYANHRTALDAP